MRLPEFALTQWYGNLSLFAIDFPLSERLILSKWEATKIPAVFFMGILFWCEAFILLSGWEAFLYSFQESFKLSFFAKLYTIMCTRLLWMY